MVMFTLKTCKNKFMNCNYGWQKIRQAIECLCGNNDSQSKRLLEAINYLEIINPEEDIPKEICKDFQDFMNEINVEKINIDHEILSEEKRAILIDKIISFYGAVCKNCDFL